MKRFIYADNAATTQLDNDAFEAMMPFLLDEFGNPSQPYSFARKPKQALKEARTVIARCINAEPDEIYFTSGGTESNNWAIKATGFSDTEKHTIITSGIEHHSVLKTCEAMERLGFTVIYLPVTQDGVVTPKSLSSVITSDTHLVSVMLANNETGTIEPVRELCEITHRNKALFHCDAVQAAGHIKIDVKELGIDMLSASAHKFNGPKGIGFLYIKKGTDVPAFINGGGQESGLRAGTENIASITGMSVALEKNCKAISENTKHIKSTENALLEKLSEENIDFIINGGTNRIPGNLSISFKNADGEALLHRLDLLGIAVSTGAACDTSNMQMSHVLKAIGTKKSYAKGTIRISLGINNTPEEAEIIAEKLISILKDSI